MHFLSWQFCSYLTLLTTQANPTLSWAPISNAPPPRSHLWFCQREIITSFFDFSMDLFYYINLMQQCIILSYMLSDFFPHLFSFLLFCLHFKDKDFCYLWISYSHGVTSKFWNWTYSIDLDSKNILQILLHVWVLQFHSFGDNSYSKKLVWFVV